MLTAKEQALVGTICLGSMPTHGTRSARAVGVYLDDHRPMQKGFIGNHAVQLGKGPLGAGGVRFPLLPGCCLPMLAFGSLSNAFQILQADERGGVSPDDAFGDYMIGVGFQPSLSPADGDQTPCRRTSAFLLQTLPQSRIMIRFRNNPFARMERLASPGRRRDRQLADTHINAHDVGMLLWRGISYLDLKGHQQIEVLLGLIVARAWQPRCVLPGEAMSYACDSLCRRPRHVLAASGY